MLAGNSQIFKFKKCYRYLSPKQQLEKNLKELNPERKPWVILVDSPLVILKSYFGIGMKMHLKDGTPTRGLFGFLNTVLKYMAMRPDYFAVAFEGEKSFRKELAPSYKDQRKDLSQETKNQIKYSYESAVEMGLNVVKIRSFEADDVIAALAVDAEKRGFFVTIISNDKDLLQVVSDNVIMVSPSGKDIYTVETATAKLGIRPSLFPDFQSMIGDAVDNIPSLPRLNKKKAAQLIEQHGSLQKLIAHLESEVESGKELKGDELIIANNKQQCLDSYRLSKLESSIPNLSIDRIPFSVPEESHVTPILDRWEMASLIKSMKTSFYSDKPVEE